MQLNVFRVDVGKAVFAIKLFFKFSNVFPMALIFPCTSHIQPVASLLEFDIRKL